MHITNTVSPLAISRMDHSCLGNRSLISRSERCVQPRFSSLRYAVVELHLTGYGAAVCNILFAKARC